MGAATILGLVASIVVGLKNSQGQPLVGSMLASIIPAAQSVVTSVVADIATAKTVPQTSATIELEALQALAALLVVLKGTTGLSANTLAEIDTLDKALQEGLAAYAAAKVKTDPSLLTVIPKAV